MAFTQDPYSGLKLYELSHVWNASVPSYPGLADVSAKRAVKHAQHGVLAWKIHTSMHTGTHLIAPIFVEQKTSDVASLPREALFGNGIVLDVKRGSYDTITSDDLAEAAKNVVINEGDFIVINTGWHHKYSDALEYYGEAPGIDESAAQWLATFKPSLVAIDTPFLDHPLATIMGPHRGGPMMKRLAGEYKEATGIDPKEKHGKWNIAHKTLAKIGIPVVVQVGGDIDDISGKRATFAAQPWKIEKGDACQIRFVAITDPSGEVRIPAGTQEGKEA
jgi:kynurenine formamidase